AFFVVLLASTCLTRQVLAQNGPATTSNDGKREFTISGCLLRNGYATYKIEEAKVDAIEGKPVKETATSPTRRLKIWTLEGGGNLGPPAGEKVQAGGRSDWAASTSSDGPTSKPPQLDVVSLKTLAASCP